MGKIRKERGRWVVDFRLPRVLAMKYGVARFRKYYLKKAVASKVHGKICAAIALNDVDDTIGKLLAFDDSEYTVETFYQRFHDEYCKPRLEKSTLKLYEYCFRNINAECGKIPLIDFRRQHLHGYIQKRVTQITPTAVNKDIIACKRMFSYATEVGAIDIDPLVRFPTLRVQEKALRIPTAVEFKKLVNFMPDPAIGAMVAIFGETAIRRSEAINLEWKNIDLRNGIITLEKTKGKKVRRIPLSDFALEKFRALTRFIHQPYVFCHQITGERWKSPDKKFREGRKKAKLEWITMHTLRHMRSTRWVQLGVDIRVVQEMLGHADVKTTMRYSHFVQSHADKAIREAQQIEKAAGAKREQLVEGKK